MEKAMRKIMWTTALCGLFFSMTAAYAAEPTIRDLVTAVNAADERARLVAMDSLGLLGEKAAAAVPTLVTALKDPSAAVRSHAAQALGAIGAPAKPAVPELATLIADPDKVVRREAVEAIGRIHPGADVSVPLLTKLIENADPQTRHAAITTLAEQGQAAVPLLIKALAQKQAAYWACLVLARIGPDAKEAVPALTALIDDQRPEVRREAILALAEIGDAAAPAIPRILKALDDPHAKTAAVFALGQFRKATGNAEAKIRQNVDSSDQVLDAVSLWALARLHPDDKKLIAQTTQRLCETLKSENPRARQAAARALGSLKPGVEIVLPAMVKAFQGASEETIHDALDTLASFGSAAVPELIGALRFERARPYVVVLLGQQGAAAKPAVGALIKLLDDDNTDVRREAVLALGRIGPDARAAVPALIRRFTECFEREGADCYGVTYALGRIGSHEAVPVLLKAIEGQDESLAMFGAWALAQIEPKDPATAAKTLPLLVRGLHNPEAKFRRGAAEALKQLGPAAKPAVPELQKALKDEDASVRSVVEDAIAAASQ
jgi:HEAT repeat protein